MGRLHPAVFERYGVEACQAYLDTVIANPMQLEVLAVTAQGPWNWELDERSTSIDNAFSVQVRITAQGQTAQKEIHFAPGADGTIMWFTDCGDPLP
jgi:hypothetical protein